MNKLKLLQSLETRRLLADMSINGTSRTELIFVRQLDTSTTSATIEVSNKSTGTISVEISGSVFPLKKNKKQTFTDIGELDLVDLRGGDDRFFADASILVSIHANGGDGNDTIVGGNADDILSGDKDAGAFNDSINGGGGRDTMFGSGGNDVLTGDSGNDSIRGGTGIDTINGGKGRDRMAGEADDDSFTNFDNAVDTLDGGDGTDSSQPPQADGDSATNVEQQGVAQGFDNHVGTSHFSLVGTTGDDMIDARIDSANTLFVTINGIPITYTAAQRIAIVESLVPEGNEGPIDGGVYIYGLAGNDTITVDSRDDAGVNGRIRVVVGGDGNDRITTTSGAQTIFGGPGNDLLIASDHVATGGTLIGDKRNQQFSDSVDPTLTLNFGEGAGADGNDTLVGSNRNDYLNGGGGADLFRPLKSLQLEGDEDAPHDGIDFDESELDTFDMGSRRDRLTVNFYTGLTGRDGGVTILFGYPKTFISGSSNDTIVGSGGPDSILGNGGSDVVDSGGSRDTVFGGDGDDQITAGSGNDRLFGGAGNDTLVAGNGNDFLQGDAGSDSLQGDIGDDYFNDDVGARDTIAGGSGRDTTRGAAFDIDLISDIEVLT
jgi:Ca2+-binding RTX toxin-like protein